MHILFLHPIGLQYHSAQVSVLQVHPINAQLAIMFFNYIIYVLTVRLTIAVIVVSLTV